MDISPTIYDIQLSQHWSICICKYAIYIYTYIYLLANRAREVYTRKCQLVQTNLQLQPVLCRGFI